MCSSGRLDNVSPRLDSQSGLNGDVTGVSDGMICLPSSTGRPRMLRNSRSASRAFCTAWRYWDLKL